MEYATLNNGIKMPMAGIGTFLLTPDEAETSVLSALQCGYRLIDTANAYVNEKAVGRAMRKSGIPRDEIFLETKLWPSFYEQEDAVEKTLQRLGTDYIDLLLIHQPAGNYRLFGINKLMLAGGGIVNGSFLAENLVDELSLVIAPVADGGNGVSSFTQVDFLPSWQPTAFHLKEVQTVVPNVLWVRYTRP